MSYNNSSFSCATIQSLLAVADDFRSLLWRTFSGCNACKRMARQAAARTLSMSCGVRASWPRMGCAAGRWIASILWFFLRGCRLRVCVWPGRLRMPSASDDLRACEFTSFATFTFPQSWSPTIACATGVLVYTRGGACAVTVLNWSRGALWLFALALWKLLFGTFLFDSAVLTRQCV